jgi:hypothetical protein
MVLSLWWESKQENQQKKKVQQMAPAATAMRSYLLNSLN